MVKLKVKLPFKVQVYLGHEDIDLKVDKRSLIRFNLTKVPPLLMGYTVGDALSISAPLNSMLDVYVNVDSTFSRPEGNKQQVVFFAIISIVFKILL